MSIKNGLNEMVVGIVKEKLDEQYVELSNTLHAAHKQDHGDWLDREWLNGMMFNDNDIVDEQLHGLIEGVDYTEQDLLDMRDYQSDLRYELIEIYELQ